MFWAEPLSESISPSVTAFSRPWCVLWWFRSNFWIPQHPCTEITLTYTIRILFAWHSSLGELSTFVLQMWCIWNLRGRSGVRPYRFCHIILYVRIFLSALIPMFASSSATVVSEGEIHSLSVEFLTWLLRLRRMISNQALISVSFSVTSRASAIILISEINGSTYCKNRELIAAVTLVVSSCDLVVDTKFDITDKNVSWVRFSFSESHCQVMTFCRSLICISDIKVCLTW